MIEIQRPSVGIRDFIKEYKPRKVVTHKVKYGTCVNSGYQEIPVLNITIPYWVEDKVKIEIMNKLIEGMKFCSVSTQNALMYRKMISL